MMGTLTTVRTRIRKKGKASHNQTSTVSSRVALTGILVSEFLLQRLAQSQRGGELDYLGLHDSGQGLLTRPQELGKKEKH